MAQRAAEVAHLGGHGHIVVRDATGQLGIGLAVGADEDILQTGREAVGVGALIEIVHDAEELLIRAIQRSETPEHLVVGHAELAAIEVGHKVVAAQIIVADGNTELVGGDTTEKQAGAMALILTGDRIAHDLFWNGEEDPKIHGEERLTPELVTEFLATKGQVDVAKRAYQYILGVIAENSLNFISGSRVVWGKVDDCDPPTRVDFVKTVLERVLSDAGFDFDAIKKRWVNSGYIEYNETRHGYASLTRIGGIPTLCVRINLPKSDPELADYNGPVPFK